ncbi:hypothetical protein EDB80DRAFT_768716 [Ilyonectria destructans]|nr:hypothetical protein EDB80DRAFT_768716 [Ilyonectria destructans]
MAVILASLNDDENKMTSTPKKRRLDGSSALIDPDATPRPGAGARMRSSASETSSVSGASSPKKQMMSLRLSETGVEWLALNENTVPEVARTLPYILPDVLRPTITEKLKARNMDHRRWRHCFKLPDEGDALPGRIPSIEEVEKVLMKATECENFKHEEASWNSQVHLRLLEGIFEELLGGQCDDFNAVSCTSARPHREFKPISSTTKMIDICLNGKKDLQTGVWHAAQWAFLRWGFKGEKLAALSKLGFIPGVIVQGNGWHLVLSTYEDGKTKLWTTKGLLDIYAVVAGMRELTAWARDVYLPWFRTYILD